MKDNNNDNHEIPRMMETVLNFVAHWSPWVLWLAKVASHCLGTRLVQALPCFVMHICQATINVSVAGIAKPESASPSAIMDKTKSLTAPTVAAPNVQNCHLQKSSTFLNLRYTEREKTWRLIISWVRHVSFVGKREVIYASLRRHKFMSFRAFDAL